MAHIQRITITRYFVPDPQAKGKKKRRRANKGTPGAYAVREKTPDYYLFDGRRRVRKLYTDKKASEKSLADYETDKARDEVGLTDRYSVSRSTPTTALVEEFLRHFLAQPGMNDKYTGETARILRKTVQVIAPDRLANLTPECISTYLVEMTKPGKGGRRVPVAPNTKKKVHSALSVFSQWLFNNHKTRENIILRVPIPTGGVQQETMFRPLKLAELRRLFRAARSRAVTEVLLIRNGPRTGEPGKKVKPEVLEAARRTGRERSLVYRTAALTGLRRAELGKLRVRFLKKTARHPFPIFDLPGEVTKNGQPAKLWVPPELYKRLRRWVKDTGRGPDDLLFTVPDFTVVNNDLAAAGVPLLTDRGKASMHSLRSAANVLLRKAKVPVNVRRLFMRHSDIRLTDVTYDDATLLDMKDVVPALEKYKLA